MLAVLLYVLDVGCLVYDCCFVMVDACWLGLCFDVAVGAVFAVAQLLVVGLTLL